MATASLPTLLHILSDEALLAGYLEFARKEHSDENVTLASLIFQYQSGGSLDEKIAKAKEIHSLIKSGLVNSSSKIRSQLDGVVDKLSKWDRCAASESEVEVYSCSLDGVVSEIERFVFRDLIADSLPRFLYSAMYKEHVSSSSPTPIHSTGVSSRHAFASQPLLTLSMESPSERTTTLLALLDHPGTQSCFVEFCKQQHNEENVELLLKIREFRQPMSAEDRKVKAKDMISTYIRAGSKSEANVDSRTRMLAEVFLNGIAHHGFMETGDELATPTDALAKVEVELINMLSGEVLPRFAVSKAWQEYSKTAKEAAADSKHASGWRRMLGVAGGKDSSESKPEEEPPKTPDTVASLRDKFYVFGLSVKPSLFKFGSSKKAELEALGTEIKATQLRAGYIFKRAHHKPSWKRRWFVLTPTMLAYYDSPASPSPNGVVVLSEITVVGRDKAKDSTPLDDAKTRKGLFRSTKDDTVDEIPADVHTMSYTFWIQTPHRPYVFQGSSERDRARWLFAIHAAMRGDLEAARNVDVAMLAATTPVDAKASSCVPLADVSVHAPIPMHSPTPTPPA